MSDNLQWLDRVLNNICPGNKYCQEDETRPDHFTPDEAKAAIATKLEQVELETRLEVYADYGGYLPPHAMIRFKKELAELKARLTQKGDSDE